MSVSSVTVSCVFSPCSVVNVQSRDFPDFCDPRSQTQGWYQTWCKSLLSKGKLTNKTKRKTLYFNSVATCEKVSYPRVCWDLRKQNKEDTNAEDTQHQSKGYLENFLRVTFWMPQYWRNLASAYHNRTTILPKQFKPVIDPEHIPYQQSNLCLQKLPSGGYPYFWKTFKGIFIPMYLWNSGLLSHEQPPCREARGTPGKVSATDSGCALKELIYGLL